MGNEIHEAVHCVIAHYYRIPIERVSIKDDAECVLGGIVQTEREYMDLINFLIAPWLYEHEDATGSHDLQRVNELLSHRWGPNPDDMNRVYAKCKAEAESLLRNPILRRQIEELSRQLLDKETLLGEQVYEILNRVCRRRSGAEAGARL